MAKMLLPFKLGLGGRLGSGRQWMSWIHIDDVVGILLAAAESDQYRGPVNAVSPDPVTNREFTRVLAGVLHRPLFPVPALALRMAVGGILGSTARFATRIAEGVAQRAGYDFRYPSLADALRAVVEHRPAH